MRYGVNMEVMLQRTETQCGLWCKHGSDVRGN